MSKLISIGGVNYYINFEALDALISNDESLAAKEVSEKEIKTFRDNVGAIISSEEIIRTYQKNKEIDGARYDSMGLMLNILLTTDFELDDALGLNRGLMNAPLNWKIAFNTLLKYNVLISED